MAEISYGGQAVIEGVMIRSPRYVSVACRLPQPDGSLGGPQTAIDIHTEPVRSPFTKRPWLRRIPLLRGMVALFEMLNMGLRALERSANLQLVTQLVAALAVALTVDPDPAETDESVAAGGEARRRGGAMSAYSDLVRARIEQNWLRPPSARAGLDCTVRVTQVPGGEVIAAVVSSCNGDEAVRESIVAAVLRASPLPAPPSAELFERILVIRFRPDE